MSASQRRRETQSRREMPRPSSPSLRVSLLFFLLSLSLSLSPYYFLSSSALTPFEDVSLDKPILQLHLAPSLNDGHSCDRVRITSLSRLDLKSYASSRRVSLNVSEPVSKRLHGKIEVCFHRNASLGLCQCEKDEWQVLQKSQWSATISPYENRYIDVKFKDKASSSIPVSIGEEFQRWRLVCLGIGVLLLLSAPIVSNWVPFYYSSSMALGVLLVVLLILFQGMKLLPMGRKNVLYLTLYGSLLGVGSFIAHYFSTVVNSILVNFGLSEEMHNPVSVFLLVGIVLAGAALGYWIVRKYVLSEDGGVDAGIAQFVKWAMRVIAVVFIFQSTLDALLAVVALCTSWCICSSITSRKWWSPVTSQHTHMKNLWLQRTKQAEFLSRSPRREIVRNVRANPNSAHVWSSSPTTGLAYSSPNKKLAHQHENYFSTFHKTPTPRKFSRKEWEDFTRKSTSEALAEWSSTPEVAKWLADNAHRMRLVNTSNSEDSMESSSGSSEETEVENGSGLNLFHWY